MEDSLVEKGNYIYENSLSAKGSLIEKGNYIENVVEQIFGFDEKKVLIEKYKFYCKYLLSLNKDYVNNSFVSNFYEECEDYFKELESNSNDGLENEQIEKQFINTYQSKLASEGELICKEIESQFDEYDLFKMEKAYNYSNFISYLRGVDPKLYERCQKYKSDFRKLNKYKKKFIMILNLKEKKNKN